MFISKAHALFTYAQAHPARGEEYAFRNKKKRT